MKYHVVLGAKAEVAGRLLARVRPDMQGAGSVIRRFPGEHLWVSNFKGSEDIASYRKQIVWDVVDGVQVGTIKGAEWEMK